MKRVVVVACLAAGLQGCAGSSEQSPSYLGASLLAGEATAADNPEAAPNPSLRHIPSNKVLGAMAFQKVTGQTVDPGRLGGSQ